jgi:hypothetical protein
MDCAIPSEYLTEKGPKREKGAHENIRRGHVLWEEQSADVGNSAIWSTAWEVDCRDIMHRYIHEEGMNLEIQCLELLGRDSHNDAMV